MYYRLRFYTPPAWIFKQDSGQFNDTYPGQCLLAFISVYVFTHKYAAQLQFFFLECYNYQAFLTSISTVVVLQYAHLAVCPRDSSIDMFFTKQGEQNV